MPLDWDDEDEDEATALEYRKPLKKILVHEEVTTPLTEGPDESPATKPAKLKKTPLSISEAPELAPGLSFATLQDRFVAFFIDSLFIFYAYWILGGIFNAIYKVSSLKTLHQSPGRWGLHLGSTLLLAFLYYFIMESSSGATWGKKICRLQVLEENGRKPAPGNVFIRNILRVLDYPFGFIVAVIMMESSSSHQRLGDRAARTMVVKKVARATYPYDLQRLPLASSFSRVLAGILDLFLVLLLLYSAILIPSAKDPMWFFVTLVSLPLIFIFYFSLLEVFTETSPGKALLGRKAIQNNGEKLHFTSAFLRNFWKPFDYFIGYPLMVLGKRKQRLGDLAADTLVIAQRSSAKALAGTFLALLLISTTTIFGFRNPESFIRVYYQSSPVDGIRYFISSIYQRMQGQRPNVNSIRTPPSLSEKSTLLTPALVSSQKLQLKEFFFAAGPGKVREDARFNVGEPIFLMFKIQGFSVNERGRATYQQELTVENSQKQIVQEPSVLVRRSDNLNPDQAIMFSNNVRLGPEAKQDRYRALVKVTDETNHEILSFEKFFEIE